MENRRKRNCWDSDGDNICGDAVYTGSGEEADTLCQKKGDEENCGSSTREILRLFFNGYEFKIFSATRYLYHLYEIS